MDGDGIPDNIDDDDDNDGIPDNLDLSGIEIIHTSWHVENLKSCFILLHSFSFMRDVNQHGDVSKKGKGLTI